MDKDENKDTNDAPDALNDISAGGPSPKEVCEQMERYLKGTEGLIMLLRESFTKGEEQLMALKAFDMRASQLKSNVAPIDTTTLQDEIEEVRQRIVSLEKLRDQVKSDIEKVKAIGEKIADFVSQYRQGS